MNVRVYAVGGMGSNVAKQLRDLDVDVCYVDTSMSNLKNVPDDRIFLVPDIDGAGKDRRISYNGFKDIVGDILIKFKPSSVLNVVIGSASGGSGSVGAPLLTKELISNDYNTVVVCVETRNSLKELNNSIDTFRSYKGCADAAKRSISLYHIESTKRAEADQEAINFINLLLTITNKRITDEFDTTDLHNFINYNKVTDNTPSVSILSATMNDNSVVEKGTSVVSSILISKDRNATIKNPVPEYLCNCVITDEAYTSGNIRLDNVLGKLTQIVDSLEKDVSTHQDSKKLNKIKDIEVNNTNDDGMVI